MRLHGLLVSTYDKWSNVCASCGLVCTAVPPVVQCLSLPAIAQLSPPIREWKDMNRTRFS